jgi:glyoxalase family protein
VPPGSLEFWSERLTRYGVGQDPFEVRFGRRTLPLVDPHGQRVALVEAPDALTRTFAPWDDSPIEVERQIRGLESARLWEHSVALSSAFLTGVLGFRAAGREGDWHRFAVGGGGTGEYIDLREVPSETRRGSWGVGSIHHLAWRVADDAQQLAVRAQVDAAGLRPTPVIDRFWFRSVYFLEPGGVLFELATDGPGFAVDEDPKHLGEALVLPPWLESQRQSIEAGLPRLSDPSTRPVA